MSHKNFFAFSSLLLLLASEPATAALCSNIHTAFTIGTGYTSVGSAQNVWLYTTPSPGLENNYTTGGKHSGTVFAGLALEKTFETGLNNVESALGIEADYIRNNMAGVVNPMVNVAPDFDTLDYSYDLNSLLLQATAKISVLDLFPNWGAYLQAGLGGILNKFSSYTETSPPGSSASPMLRPFSDATHRNFAYSIGAGLIYQLNNTPLLIGYRYINTGVGGFNTSPVQGTNNTLDFKPLTHHLLTFTLIV